jgi:copper chaperone CopZ
MATLFCARFMARIMRVFVSYPRWLSDIETASALIMVDETPDNVGNKCILQDVIYRVIVARYEVYKDARRAIYVAFLPASTQPFDLTRTSSTLLSSLILSVRFREQIIPLADTMRQAEPDKLGSILQGFYRLLVGVEMEARQFGLVLDNNIPADEAPLTTVMSDPSRKIVIQASIDAWSADRRQIEEMFVGKPVDLSSTEQAQHCANEIIGALERIKGVNAEFIETITVELLAQMKERDRRSASRKTAGRTIAAKSATSPSKSKSDRKRARP